MIDRHRPPLPPCTDEAQGRNLGAYLARELEPEAAKTFEEHYFSCAFCLEEIRMRQTVGQVFHDSAIRPGEAQGRKENARPIFRKYRGAWAAAAAAAVVIASGAAIFLLRGDLGRANGAGKPFRLQLTGVYRGESGSPQQAPADTPLELTLLFPASRDGSARYDVEILGPDGASVFEAAGLQPTDASSLVVRLEEGLNAPGRYLVNVNERTTNSATPLTMHYAMKVLPDH